MDSRFGIQARSLKNDLIGDLVKEGLEEWLKHLEDLTSLEP